MTEHNAETPELKPFEQQADGYVETDDGLVEELADTATIEGLLEGFIQEISEMFSDLVDVSVEGNPVRTHIELTNVGNDVLEMAYNLKHELVTKLANRADAFAEQGGNLRKQVIEEA